ncbi:hypothetical protein COY23_03785 [bacterium (Candidatus Torokbacteria) CG_4_10_14_0_2_um_filter_35_8]|nr:MAG: hypothetical protein COY23_03785 [bacterium (Candidatus Torokbacteria) CG_4_10_14_0_2_um_filter_35_8]
MLSTIKKRRSIRDFLEKEVEEEKLQEILKAAMFSPSARHIDPWEFLVVKDKNIIKKLCDSCVFSSFFEKAPIVIVIVADESKSDYWVEDSAIAAENIYLEVTNQGLGTCYIQIRDASGEVKEKEKYVREVFSVPDNIRIQCLMPIGYPAEYPGEHSNQEFDESKIHWDEF